MGDMFRSEKMALCQMFIQPEAGYTSIAELGVTGCVQFRDLNGEMSSFQRRFVNEVRRCDELERKIRYIKTELNKEEIPMLEITENEPPPPNPREVNDFEAQLESIENEIRELSQNEVNLKSNYLGMIELKQVLESTEGFFSDSEVINLDINRFVNSDDQNAQGQQRDQLKFVAGVIELERYFAFERMLWRISRGNIFLKRSDLNGLTQDPQTRDSTLKTVFVAFFQGEQLQQRIMKVCSGFHAAVYPCPSAHSEREVMIKDVRVRLEDLKLVLNQTADHRNRALVSTAKLLPNWVIMVKKMKAIYHTLNLFDVDVSHKCLIGEGWVPVHDLYIVQEGLAKGSAAVESAIPSFLNVIPTNEQPPTFVRTNKFTNGFQNLIDSYGVSSYREVNPALYTCIIFPFLFAVMFGDLGHGVILFLVGFWMCLSEKKLSKHKGEIFQLFFGGRYIILLMGLFAMYTGLVYNDIFSKSMNIFGASWEIRYNTSTVLNNTVLQLDPRYASKGVYAIGMDPIWQFADNKIIFLNTYKMKMSIIIGVLHMIFGVCLSLVNYIHFRKWMNILTDFLPQILFLLLLFGYMVFMMFFKMVKYSADADDIALTPGCAPSILILFINMMLQGHTKPLDGCKEYLFEGQDLLQKIFVVLAVLCIPWMLLGKPIIVMMQRRSLPPALTDANANTNTNAVITSHGTGDEPMSEVFIQQAIHTIEYVLSTISHTASYLRLWALSLAHAQLSDVLWNMILSKAFVFFPNYSGAIALYIIFSLWAVLTVGILVLIEGLSAFLHTLRLHWVEFMSKFYEGLGYPFTPFSFKTIMETSEEE